MSKLLIQITRGPEDPTRAALGFLVGKAAVDEGHDVSLFLAGDAVQLLRDAVLDNLAGLGTGRLRESYEAIVAGGGRFYLSGMSSKARGLSDEDIAGIPAEMAMPNRLVQLTLEHDRVPRLERHRDEAPCRQALVSDARYAASAGRRKRSFQRRRRQMALQLGDTAPDFEAETTEGRIHFHDWMGDSWAVLFSHPKDFTPVCTTELGYMAKIKPEFDRRNVKVIGLSVDPVTDHERWASDIEETQGHAPNYPMIGDGDFSVSKLYGMLPASVSGDPGGRTPADNQTVRNVFVIGPDKKVKLVLVYPMTTGRNFDEVLRVIDSLQLTSKHKVATPVNWQQGDKVIIAGSVSDDQARETYPDGWESPRPYIRIVPQPS